MTWIYCWPQSVFLVPPGWSSYLYLHGFAVLAGVAASSFGPAEAAAIIDNVAFGLFGPHIAFSAGAAAAAYAGSRGLIESGKDVTTPLIKLGDPTVLPGGGICILGHILIPGSVSIAHGHHRPYGDNFHHTGPDSLGERHW